MTRILLLALVAVALGSPLSAATAKDLEGSWKLDADALWDQMKDRVPAEHQDMAKTQMMERMAGITFTIGADRVEISGPEGKQEEATYTVKGVEGDAITIETTAKDEVRTMTATLTDGGQRLAMTDGKGNTIRLLRVGGDAAASVPAPEAPAAKPAERVTP